MDEKPTVTVIGGTGMLGRPVVRRLVRDGFPVRAIVRDRERAAKLLPEACELVAGDVLHAHSIRRCIDGAEVVYINLSSPNSKRPRDAQVEGCKLIEKVAAELGVGRLMKISAMGVAETRREWWLSDRMMQSDEAIMNAGVPYTIFYPTWFMESLPLFLRGGKLTLPRTPDYGVYWISGDDYARQVAAAIMNKVTVNRTYTVQGPEAVSFADAAERFAAAHPEPLKVSTFPMVMIRALALVWSQAAYFRDLLSMTFKTNTTFQAEETCRDLGTPSMTIEQYVAYMIETGDVPSK